MAGITATRRFRLMKAIVALAFAAALGIASYHAIRLYLRFGPTGVCRQAPAGGPPSAKPFRLSDPDAPDLFGSHAGMACPEARPAFFEWYALRVHSGGRFMDVIIELRGADQKWGIAGMGIWSAASFRPVAGTFEIGEDGSWPVRGADTRLVTRGPQGRDESFFRLLESGPRAGSYEVRVLTREADLHLFIEPLVPGFSSKDMGSDRTRPGSWYQYQCLTIMGRAEGELKLFRDGKPVSATAIPASPDETAISYIEHIWGQGDRPPWGTPSRFYWDWGNWGRPEDRSAVFFVQSDRVEKDITSVVAACIQGGMPLLFHHHPPASFARAVYSRLADEGGHLYPQIVNVWAFAPDNPGAINMRGHVRASYGDWQAYELVGRAGDATANLDWNNKPVWSVDDFYKGAQVKELIPPPPKNLKAVCGGSGCRLTWDAPAPNEEKIKYWVFRLDGQDRLDPGTPVAVLEPGAGSTVGWTDPNGAASTIYKVFPMRAPPTLFHQRFQAGYERSTSSPDLAPESIPRPPAQGPRPGPGASSLGVSLVREGFGGTRLEPRSGKIMPRFGPRLEIQSFDCIPYSDAEIACVWSERTPILDSGEYTGWEVFASITNTQTGSFRLSSLSMSDSDSINAQLSLNGNSLSATWLECEGDECRRAQQPVPLR